MRASWYARALYELHQGSQRDEATLVKHFVDTVSRNGHAHMLRKIVAHFEKLVRRGERDRTIEVHTAQEIPEKEVLTLLKKAPFSAVLSGAEKRVVRKTDPSLVGGAIVRSRYVRVDASYKRMLTDLYQSLITRG